MDKAHTEYLVQVAIAARNAKHGQKQTIYADAATHLSITTKTLHNWLNQVAGGRNTRKQRSDIGTTGMEKAELYIISAYMKTSERQTGRRLRNVAQAVKELRANGKIKAEYMDKNTGEIRQYSDSAIERALRANTLHPEQLGQDSPVRGLKSSHPNQCWQLDASVCVLYYLPRDKALQAMPAAEFNKNKPGNFKKIESDRVTRYAITDHASGTVYLEYVYGGESSKNLLDVFINAMQWRGRNDPFHGVPDMLMLDPGSANTSALLMSLCRLLDVRPLVNEPGNPRAKGQVEGMHNIIERNFEGGLRFIKVATLEELNDHAHRWMRNFNATATHSRHGMTRYAAWSRINQQQLRKAPDGETCRELINSGIKTRKVNQYLHVSWNATKYAVSHIPDVYVNREIEVSENPWLPGVMRVHLIDKDGKPYTMNAEAVTTNEFGWDERAAEIGEEYKRHADTAIEIANKTIEEVAYGKNTEAQATGRRKAKAIPFNGEIDPYKPLVDAEPNLPDWMEKRGQASTVVAPDIRLRPLSLVEAAKSIRSTIGPVWLPECFAELKAMYPAGDVPQEHIEDLKLYFMGRTDRKPVTTKPALRVVGG
ncbi:DDE-type integrase/transposase/recombinase [Thiothrix lacustris]|uniref:DDE-type integrase/transposase/recombinase n=1 Tax=Thiothrix lacustris TaxID=525917 RepID=UPI0006862D9A|nr:DDE-type integrase/transposase/recombinase [Thiothrix lacustris]